MKKGKNLKKKEVEVEDDDNSEDYCFICKDGGELIVCDFKKCVKAYHPDCLGKDTSVLSDNDCWTCSLHTCNCGKSSTFQCLCCPISYCRSCIRSADFAHVKKKTKGFCINCLKVTLMIEEERQVDSDGEEVDFQNRDTYECLFKEYWELLVKDQEGLTLKDIQVADKRLNKGGSFQIESDSEKLPEKLSEEESMSEPHDLEDDSDDGKSYFKDIKGKRTGIKKHIKKSRKEITFTGWASEELIRFLASIGKDTTKPLHQLDVTNIVKAYIQSNNLFHQNKRKKNHVIPDERLQFLFRKKKLKYHQISDLVRGHLAEEHSDEDEELSFGSVEDEGVTFTKKQRNSNSDSRTPRSELNHYGKKVPGSSKSSSAADSKTPRSELYCHKRKVPEGIYAAIVVNNIKLAYLKKSLIVELLKDPETFEDKFVGCFVKVKNDPTDFNYSVEKAYQLGQVKGIKKAQQLYKIGETSTDIVLCISNFGRDIKISMLSDDDIEEVECEDLRQLVKKGLFKRPTIVELESKTRSVHKDIMNHWINKELAKLQKQIDRANEKGWRKELNEYIDRRELLNKPEERMRLLEKIPEVIADIEIDTEAEVLEVSADIEGDIEANVTEPLNLQIVNKAGNVAPYNENVAVKTAKGTNTSGSEDPREIEGNLFASCKGTAKRQGAMVLGSIAGRKLRRKTKNNRVMEKSTKISEIPIIDLDEDGDDDNIHVNRENCRVASDACDQSSKAIWHYEDPSGNKHGPFSLNSLRCWKEDGFVGDKLKVWRSGQNKADAIQLATALASNP